jgi:hypothetical protein
MTDETYNGWKNYPTWAVNLWLSNDRELYNETLSQVRELIENIVVREPFTREEAIRYETASTLQNWVTDDLAPDLGASFAADLLSYALSCVDWHEIADAWIENVQETV